MACRLPGNVHSPAEFWELCSRARSGYMAGVPKDRFSHEAYYDSNPGKTGTYHSQGGYFLGDDLALFDAPFFSLTEKEAIAMDPQQRLLLECTFEALENAGIPKQKVVGQDVGVFIGGSLSEYETHLSRDSDSMPMYQSTGCAQAMQSNRLSHFFDFRGPSFTLDTACSSSLVALHVACQSIRNGEAQVAITGGCHLNMLPDSFISFSTGRLLSDSGKSIAFDERGTGFGRGEGCGILVLKPLDRAIADKDAIRAVIRGTGINQDGKTAGITMPNGDAQERLINQVYNSAGLDPIDCGFVEAHGTGTKIGDPTEAGAIYRSLGQGRTSKDPLYIGSVKSNIGHLEAASGVAAVIKSALSLERGFILPNHDFKKPNSKIPWKEWNLAVPKAQRPWPKGKKYISVNNFGFGGTNCHIVLERAPFATTKKSSLSRKATGISEAETNGQAQRRMFVLSGNDKQSLESVMANLVVYLEQRPEIFQSDLLDHLSYTLSRRALLKWRVAIPAATSFELIEALNSNGILPSKASVSGQGHTSDLGIGFVFTGQGAQWHAMGRELYGPHGFPAFAAALDRADRYLRKMGAQWSLVDELIHRDAQSSRVSDANISQPACTAVQLCLVDLLRSWRIRPNAVTGHSSGEIAAAYAAGFITFKSAMAIAYHRGRMIPILKESFPRLKGMMMAVGGSKEDIQPLIDNVNSSPELQQQGSQIRVACYNSPSSLTISGDTTGIDLLERIIQEQKPETFNRRLQVDVAYHSHHMNLVAKEYKEALDSLDQPRSVSGIKFYSSLYGREIEGIECDAAYWVDNLTRPVRFSEALDNMIRPASEEEAPISMLVELGPHSALQGPIKQVLQAAGLGKDISYNSALVRKRSAVDSTLDLASAIFAKGGVVYVDAINSPHGTDTCKASLLTDLPRYAWNHSKRYWHETRLSRMHTHRGLNATRSELIGVEAIYSTSLEPTWRNVFFLDDLPWLRHHRIQGLVVFPLAAFVTMAVEAATQQARNIASTKSSHGELGFNAVELRDVEVLRPLAFAADVVDGNSNIEMSISLRRRHDASLDESWDEFHISSWSSGQEWTEHCVGLVKARSHDNLKTAKHDRTIREAKSATDNADAVNMSTTETSAMYSELSGKLGVEYGPSFQAIRECSVAGCFAAAEVSTTPSPDKGASTLHPATLESIIDTYWPILRNHDTEMLRDTVFLPSSIRHMFISANDKTTAQQDNTGLRAYCSADFGKSQPRPTSVDILASAASSGVSNLLVAIEGLVVSPILNGSSSTSDASGHNPREVCYKLEWEPLQLAQDEESQSVERPLPQGDIVILYNDADSLTYLLASQLAVNLESETSRLPALEESVFNSGCTKASESLRQLIAGKTCIVLTEIDRPFISEADESQFEALKTLATEADRVLWITQGAYIDATQPSSNMISGLSRTIRSETTKPFAHLDLQGNCDLSSTSETISMAILDVLRAAFGSAKFGDMEFAYRSNELLVPRVVNDSHMDLIVQRGTDPHALELQPYGQASADGRALRMQFEVSDMPLKASSGPAIIHEVCLVDDISSSNSELGHDEIEFEVMAVGVNTHDAIAASSQRFGEMGLEASGVVTRIGKAVSDPKYQVGCRIACLTTAMKQAHALGAYGNFARTTVSMALSLSPGNSIASSKTGMTFEEAAALPLAYTTAYHALMNQARLEAGQSVLITCASEPVGQAAICLALTAKSEVYVLARSLEEKLKITENYAGVIPNARVLSSYANSDGTQWESRETLESLKEATLGNGFDVVLDLLHPQSRNPHLEALLKACVAPFGCHVHVQGPSLSSSQESGTRHNLHGVQPSSLLDELTAPTNASYITVDMLALGRERPQVLDRVFKQLISMFDGDKLTKIQGVETLPYSRAHEALNKVHDTEKNAKKFVVVPQIDDLVLAPPHPALASTNILKADASYIIVGGTGGLGRSMARWMMQNGARYIVLLSRRATITTAVQALMDEAEASGAQVLVQQCDISNEKSVSTLLTWVSNDAKLPPVCGVIHSAMVLRDVLFEKMSHAEYKDVIESKVQGAWNLHRALDGSDNHCKLDFFVAISSVAAIVGNRGQAAYAAANTYLDALVQHRLSRGLPAVSLALAAVSDAGYLADSESGASRAEDVIRNLGGDSGNTICEAEVLALLYAALTGETAFCQHHVITGVAVKGRRPQPFWAGDEKFTRILGDVDLEAGEDSNEAENGATVLSPKLTQSEAEDVVCRGLVAKIAVVLMMEPEELDVTRNLSHYPLDSLVAIEVRNFIARQYEASLQVLELLSSGSIQTLSTIVCRKSKLCQFAD
ncbi:Type I Iterative PKS [Gnomoniopsis sp. IMI 355080]|nr:Type I Iterative PKS [Gnomoniopsis sp. IMI 355080]